MKPPPTFCPFCGGNASLHDPGCGLNQMADLVLAHKPKPKSKPARKRTRRAKKIAKRVECVRARWAVLSDLRQAYAPENMTNEEAFEKDWGRKCENCGATPVVNATGLCGPCTFGEAATAGGNW